MYLKIESMGIIVESLVLVCIGYLGRRFWRGKRRVSPFWVLRSCPLPGELHGKRWARSWEHARIKDKGLYLSLFPSLSLSLSLYTYKFLTLELLGDLLDEGLLHVASHKINVALHGEREGKRERDTMIKFNFMKMISQIMQSHAYFGVIELLFRPVDKNKLRIFFLI